MVPDALTMGRYKGLDVNSDTGLILCVCTGCLSQVPSLATIVI